MKEEKDEEERRYETERTKRGGGKAVNENTDEKRSGREKYETETAKMDGEIRRIGRQ